MDAIRRKLRNFFIPSLQNQLRPYSLRYGTLITIAVLSVTIELAFYAYVNMAFKQNLMLGSIINTIQNTVADILPDVIIEETNSNRISNDEKPLQRNESLALAAQMKAADMATRGYFSHESPDGSMAWNWMEKAGYGYSYAGENLAVNFFDARDVVKAWMDSPTHRENILNPSFTDIGIAAARGNYQGKETVFVVQIFGTPAGIDQPTKKFADTDPIIPPKPSRPAQLVGQKTAGTSTIATTSSIVIASSSPVVAKVTNVPTPPKGGVSAAKKLLVSPRHIARNAYLILLAYMALVLVIPMFMIYYKHVSADRWVRFREIFILFKQPIISALVTFCFITLAMYLNYSWGRAGSNVFNMSIEKSISKQL